MWYIQELRHGMHTSWRVLKAHLIMWKGSNRVRLSAWRMAQLTIQMPRDMLRSKCTGPSTCRAQPH